MTGDLEAFRRDYTPPLLAYLTRPEEKGRAAAYELGRRAMREELGLLAFVRVHHQVFLKVLRTARDVDEAEQLSRNALGFLVEGLASFEMTQRGFMAGEVLARNGPPQAP